MARAKGQKKHSDGGSGGSSESASSAARFRFWVLALAAPQALLFGAAAFYLPWQVLTIFTVLAGLVGLGHAATAVAAAIGHRHWPRVWRAQSFASLALLAYLIWLAGSSAFYISGLYGALGDGLAAALAAALGPAILLTLPEAIWGLAATGGLRARAGGVLVTAIVLLFVVEPVRWSASARGDFNERVRLGSDELARLAEAQQSARPLSSSSPGLFVSTPVQCEAPPDQTITVVATYLAQVGGSTLARSSCRQGSGLDVVGLAEELRAAGLRGPIKLDVIEEAQALGGEPLLAKSFVLRPGLDGVCAGARCLMPWQLIALDEFNSLRPVDFIQDLRLGVDPDELRRRLGVKSSGEGAEPHSYVGLTRIATKSYLIDADGGVHNLRRMRSSRPPLEATRVGAAVAAAEDFVASAQLEDGRFMYMIDPFTGQVSDSSFSVARQAGTTLALCELGRDAPRTRRVATRSLDMLAGLLRSKDRAGVLIYPKDSRSNRTRIGASALSLIAFLRCRSRLGVDRYDEVIAKLGQMLLDIRKPDGSFMPDYDLERGQGVDGPHVLYADGQVIFALVLLEQLQAQLGTAKLPALSAITEAVEAGMDYAAGPYWGHAARDFFFIEENWHCLAARAALSGHRHDGYERFCLDYVRFKTRYIFDDGSDVDPQFVGAYSFANVTVPYNTPTAGFAEAMSAAVDVLDARKEPSDWQRAALSRAMSYLLQAQWTEENCFACTPRLEIRGGFSESLSSPIIRIDYVQHAWAGLGHGGRVLGLL